MHLSEVIKYMTISNRTQLPSTRGTARYSWWKQGTWQSRTAQHPTDLVHLERAALPSQSMSHKRPTCNPEWVVDQGATASASGQKDQARDFRQPNTMHQSEVNTHWGISLCVWWQIFFAARFCVGPRLCSFVVSLLVSLAKKAFMK